MMIFEIFFVFLIITIVFMKTSGKNKYYGAVEILSWLICAAMWVITIVLSDDIFLSIISGILFISAIFKGEEKLKKHSVKIKYIYWITIISIAVYLIFYNFNR